LVPNPDATDVFAGDLTVEKDLIMADDRFSHKMKRVNDLGLAVMVR
jgi:hypothetical protein